MGKKTEFLYLNEEEIVAAGGLDYSRCIEVEEEVFRLLSIGDYVMGGDKHNSHGIMMKFPKESPFPNMPLDAPDRRFMAMPAYVGGRFNVAGEKWYGSNILNPSRGLPRSILMVMLNDADTCEPIALMSGNLIGSLLIFSGRGGVEGDYFVQNRVIWDNTKMHEVYFDEHMLLPENERFINGIAVQIYKFMYEGKIPPIARGTSLGDILCSTGEGRKSDDERLCFIASGMPVWDVAWGYELYQNAKSKGLGQNLKLWESSYLI